MDNQAGSLGYPLLSTIHSPADLKKLDLQQCSQLAVELRAFIVDSVTTSGGHLGSNLGAVEATIAMHRVFHSPQDVLLFDTGHQAYVHKLLTGRMDGFARLRKEGGLSGYPSREESRHDWIENSHASTALSYAQGIAISFAQTGLSTSRRVVAFVGDGALTGGMAYEALNNIGHRGSRVLVVLNDNGRSYAPTISKLSESLTQLRLSPSYGALRAKLDHLIGDLPGVGPLAGQTLRSLTSAVRELVEPHVFFEALGIRYTGPIDGHDIEQVERSLRLASAWEGPMVLHLLTRKGRGYGPAEEDEVQCLHDLKAQSSVAAPGASTDRGPVTIGPMSRDKSYTEAFSQAIVEAAQADQRVVAITAAMPGPTGLLPFEAKYPDRFIDVGIAEQHALTSAAGMALSGLRPVVAIYSTFLSRAFDQENLDIGLHRAPVVICADRSGVTGDDGPSHHGLLDMVLGLSVSGLQVFAPSEPAELAAMLATALEAEVPSLIRYPKTPGPLRLGAPGEGYRSRVLVDGNDEVVLIGVGKMAQAAMEAADLLRTDGHCATVIDPRVIRPLDGALVERAARAALVVTIEDGFAHGGAGQFIRSSIERYCDSEGIGRPFFTVLGVETRFIAQASPAVILARAGLDGESIAASARSALTHIPLAPAVPSFGQQFAR
ncbi:MAG TPA: 1-deoxy-D-xylulose-5-phosphate synthase [Acidimicrobiales bacterium]|nr:1-deoxy-D-xylulose-5-phosphate synthase [Acidimicrobiales bacterium]